MQTITKIFKLGKGSPKILHSFFADTGYMSIRGQWILLLDAAVTLGVTSMRVNISARPAVP